MPSHSYRRWIASARIALDQMEATHRAIGGAGPGRRHTTQHINQAYVTLPSGHFQGYCRDLHSEAVDFLCAQPPPPAPADPRRNILRQQLTLDRKLDHGNPNPGNLGTDFNRLGFNFWIAVLVYDHTLGLQRDTLVELNAWRNAIAHQDFDPSRLRNRSSVRLSDVRRWRAACNLLAPAFDAVVAAQLAIIVGAAPPW